MSWWGTKGGDNSDKQVNEEDMERMMRISEEMLDLDCNLQQADLDSLLNVDNFTEKQSSASLHGDKIIVWNLSTIEYNNRL